MSQTHRPLRFRQARRITPVGAAERGVGYLVLAGLVAVAVFMVASQSRFNQAVVVALSEGPLSGKTQKGAAKASPLAQILDALPGVIPEGGVEVFDPATLSDKINGKAELYLSSGFKEMAWRAFALEGNTPGRFDVYVYAMESPSSAFAVFSGQRRAGSKPSQIAPNAYATDNALFFSLGEIYVEIVADSAVAAVQAALAPLGTAISAKLAGAAPEAAGAAPDPSVLFPTNGQVPSSLRLAKSDAFGLEGFSDVYTAEYTREGEEATVFVAPRGSAGEAAVWKDKYVAFLKQNGFAPVSLAGAPGEALVFTVDKVFEVVLVKGDILCGVHEATGQKSALSLAKDLAQGQGVAK